MADRCNPATRNIYYNVGKPSKHAAAYYRPTTSEQRTRVVNPYGIGGGYGTNTKLVGPIVDGQRFASHPPAPRPAAGLPLPTACQSPPSAAAGRWQVAAAAGEQQCSGTFVGWEQVGRRWLELLE